MRASVTALAVVSWMPLALLGCAATGERGRSALVERPALAALGAVAPTRWPDGCPRGLAGWRSYRDGAIDLLLTPSESFADPMSGKTRRYLSIEQTQREAAHTDDHIKRCLAVHPASAPTHAALKNLRAFAVAVGRPERRGHEGGFNVSDAEVQRRAAAAVTLPPLLASQRFLQLLRSPKTYRRAVAMIEARNRKVAASQRWMVLLFRSRFLKTFDRVTYGRLLVVVPGARRERWVQFGIITPSKTSSATGALTQVHSFSVVAVSRPPAGARDTRRTVHIVDFWRDVRPDGRVRVRTRLDAGHHSSNCYHCHKLGVVPLRPDAIFRFDERGSLVARPASHRGKLDHVVRQLNRRIGSYGAPSFGGLLDTRAFGPPLGPVNRPRDDAFMRACTRAFALDARARARVRRHMRCAGCHDGNTTGVINYPQALRSDLDVFALGHPQSNAPQSLLGAFVSDGAMPPRAKLESDAERMALAECLMREYFDPDTLSGLLVEWLRGER